MATDHERISESANGYLLDHLKYNIEETQVLRALAERNTE
jgi:hypothetical protein